MKPRANKIVKSPATPKSTPRKRMMKKVKEENMINGEEMMGGNIGFGTKLEMQMEVDKKTPDSLLSSVEDEQDYQRF